MNNLSCDGILWLWWRCLCFWARIAWTRTTTFVLFLPLDTQEFHYKQQIRRRGDIGWSTCGAVRVPCGDENFAHLANVHFGHGHLESRQDEQYGRRGSTGAHHGKRKGQISFIRVLNLFSRGDIAVDKMKLIVNLPLRRKTWEERDKYWMIRRDGGFE